MKKLKGFTLVELILVMAIFGLLMVGAISLIDPVSKIFQSANMSEKSYSYTNNIQTYLQGTLEYSDNMRVYTANHEIKSEKYDINNLDKNETNDPPKVLTNSDGVFTDQEILDLVEEYRKCYYDNIISYDGVTKKEKTTKGKIYVMHLKNSDRGKITVRTFDFNSHKKLTDVYNPSGTFPAEVDQLNKAYFDGYGSKYSFKYVFGADKLVNVTNPTGGSDHYAALSNDFNNVPVTVSFTDLSITILMSEDSGTSVAVGSTHSYTAFKRPCAVSVANFPLMNIKYRGGNAEHRPTLKRDPTNPSKFVEDSNGEPLIDLPSTPVSSFLNEVDYAKSGTDNLDVSQDIYFIYSYADELEIDLNN